MIIFSFNLIYKVRIELKAFNLREIIYANLDRRCRSEAQINKYPIKLVSNRSQTEVEKNSFNNRFNEKMFS